MNMMMLDVEGLGKDQPWKIPLMNVGMTIFDEDAVVLQSRDLYVEPKSLPHWAVGEPETIKWWEGQASWPLMQERIAKEGISCKKVLRQVERFYRENMCKAIWFNGPLYDHVLIDSYMRFFRIQAPWKYHEVRDFRTIRKQYKDLLEEYYSPTHEVSHMAEEDCLHQVAQMWVISQRTGIKWA